METMGRPVSTKLAVLKALEDIGQEDFRDAPILTEWADDCAQAIGGLKDFEEKVEVVKIENCSAKLPCGTVEVLALILGDHGEECDTLFSTACSKSISVDWSSLDTGNGLLILPGSNVRTYTRFRIEGGRIIFNYKPEETRATLKVKKIRTDDDGFVKVPKEHLRAISYYIKMMLAERSRWGKNKMSFSDIQYFQNKYDFHARQAKAITNRNSVSEDRTAADIVNNPLAGRALIIEDYG